MDAKEKRTFDLIVEAFKENGVQVIKVDQPTSKVYNLSTIKFDGLGTVKKEIKELVDNTEPSDVVFIYDVQSVQMAKEKGGLVEWIYSVRLDLQ